MAKKTSAIIAISEKQKEELVYEHKISPAEKVHVVPLGFDLNRFSEGYNEKRKNFRSKYKLSEDEIAIGIVGRLVPVKNHSLFLNAIKFLKEKSRKKIKAFIVGDGEERTMLESKKNELGSTDEIIFTSWEKDVDKVYPGLDIVCLTSFNEGTPVSIIEAQAANKPVVSTNAGGIENIVLPGRTAFLSDSANPNHFFENLFKLTEDDTLRENFGKEGSDFVKIKFSYFRLAKDMNAVYASLIR